MAGDLDVGSTIRDARRRAGLTQAGLAERLGTTQSSVARWERGATSPTVATLERIAGALGSALAVTLRGPDVVDPSEWSSVERNLTLSHDQRLDNLVSVVEFVFEGRRAMAEARGR